MDNGAKRYERKVKTPEQALSSLMRLASRSEKSSGDALRLMRTWGVEPDAQQKILQTLQAQKFIDDRRYAAAYVREKSGLNGWGAYKIRTMLRTKGIGREIADEALAQLDAGQTKEKLEQMLARKMKSTKAKDRYEMKGKLLRHGQSLGYDYEDITDTIEKLLKNE